MPSEGLTDGFAGSVPQANRLVPTALTIVLPSGLNATEMTLSYAQ
jgi:hypothetical protein